MTRPHWTLLRLIKGVVSDTKMMCRSQLRAKMGQKIPEKISFLAIFREIYTSILPEVVKKVTI